MPCTCCTPVPRSPPNIPHKIVAVSVVEREDVFADKNAPALYKVNFIHRHNIRFMDAWNVNDYAK